MGLTWDPDFLRSPPGMAMAAQVVGSLIGGVTNIFSFSIATGLLGFAFWSTFLISGFLTLCHICNMAQTIESRFPYFSKLQLGYVVVWGLIFLICCVLSLFGFAISSIFAFVVLAAFIVDGYFKYRNYKSSMASNSDAETAGVTASSNQK